jgi:uncharacterized protein involved in exopolysaccharide biosynthesis
MAKENNSKEFRFSSVDLIVFAWEKRIPLIIITTVAFIAAVIGSLFITNLYKSKVVLYAAPNTSVSKYLLSNQNAGPLGLLAFGEEDETDQLMQILQSDQIKNKIIQKFDLLNHYDIDPDYEYKWTLLNKKMKKYIHFKRTKYMSVVVEVLDKDPYTAANIANSISDLVDTTLNQIQHDRAMIAYTAVEKEYLGMQNRIKIMEDSLDVLRSHGIFDDVGQAEEIVRGYSKAINNNDERAMRIFEKMLDNFAKYSGPYTSLSDFVMNEKKNLAELEQKYLEAKVEAEQILPQKFVVDKAAPDIKKAYPKRSLVVLQSALSAFVLSYIILLIISIIQKNKTVTR